MNKLEQAARQALEALEFEFGGEPCGTWDAITALREALAEQAEQEPVATVVDESEEQTNTMSWILSLPLPVGTKLYAAPLAKQDTHATHVVRTKDLTDDEITNAWESMGRGLGKYTEFARAVIQEFRRKNGIV